MTTINNKTLLAEKITFDNLAKNHNGYKKKTMPAVLEALKQYKATGKYPYNAQVKEFILSLCQVDESLHDYLLTEIYLAQQDLEQEEKMKQTHEMADKGYIPACEWNGYLGGAELIGTKSMDWMTSKIATTGKIIKANNGEPFFILKGKRSRGYYLRNLNNAFYKAIN